MKLKCPNKKCKYEWEYNGKHEFYATCPRCLRKVRLHQKPMQRKKPLSVKKLKEELGE